MKLKISEKHLTSSHKMVLKQFFKTIICENLSRNEIINYINDKFKSNDLEPIYSKKKLSDAISNIKFNEKKNNVKDSLKIKIRDESKFITKNNTKNNSKCKKNTEKKCSISSSNKSSMETVEMKNELMNIDKELENVDSFKNYYSFILVNDIFDIDNNYFDNICDDIQNCEELPIF